MKDRDMLDLFTMHLLLRCAVLFLLGVLLGCAENFVVMRRTRPNALAGRRVFALEPVRFEGALVGFLPEEAWLARRSERQRQSWEMDKLAFNNRYAARLLRRNERLEILLGPVAPQDALVVRTQVMAVEPGCYFTCGDLLRDTTVAVDVQVLDLSGNVLEEIGLRPIAPPGAFHAAIGTRMRVVADRLGDQVGRYLRARTAAD